MTSKDRIATALRGGIPDRVPVVNVFSMNYLVRSLTKKGEVFSGFNQENLEKALRYQEEIGHDPIYYLHTFQEADMVKLPECFMRWDDHASSDWQIEERPFFNEKRERVIRRTYVTPSGCMESVVKRERRQAWVLEHPLRNRADFHLLVHRPDPELMDLTILKSMVANLGERGLFTIGVPGVWQEGCALRGFENLVLDVFDDPQWVQEFFDLLTDYAVGVIRALARAGIDSVFVNESYVGIGMSAKQYRELVLPCDRRLIEAANRNGMISSLHICGRCNVLLEDMADSGATCIEPLAPADYSGDVDLADAKKRVGDKVGLWGGFKERVLCDEKEAVKQEVVRCLKAAAAGGGYILRGSGQVFDATQDNLKYLRDLAELYGRY